MTFAADWAMLGGDKAHTFQSSDRIPANPARLWDTKLEAGIYASPVVRANTVYVAGYGVSALNKIDGKVLWHYAAGDVMSATPTVVDDTVVVASKDGAVTALNAKDGAPKWQIKTAGRILSSPVADQGSLYFASNDLFPYALDLTDGKILWRYCAEDYRFGGLYTSPGLDGERGYIGAKNGQFHAVWSQTGKLAWRTQLGSAMYDAPLVTSDRLYLGNYDRYIYALDTATGAIVWRTALDDWPGGTAKPSTLAATAACCTGLMQAAEKPFGEELRHSFTVGANLLGVIGTVQGRMLAMDMITQRIVWGREIGAAVLGAPALADGTVFVAAQNGDLTAWR